MRRCDETPLQTDEFFRRARIRVLIFLAVIVLHLPTSQCADVQPPPQQSVIDRGPHHRTWQTVRQVQRGDSTFLRTNSYTELQNGLHRWTEQGWVETDPAIELFQDGAVVRNLQFGVIFAPNLASPGAIDISLPDGNRLTGQIMGLALTEGQTSVLIAETRDCAGEISGAGRNHLTFRQAFSDGFDIDVEYVVERAKFAQNLICRSRLPDPAKYGMTPNAFLEIYTEWTTAPPVEKQTLVVEPAHDGQLALTDERISLGIMKFVPGKAFTLGQEQNSVPISSSWEQIENRTFLIEKVPWRKIADEMQKLPPSQASAKPAKPTETMLAKKGRALPAVKRIAAKTKPIEMAKVSTGRGQGFNIDFDLATSTNFHRFAADSTTYISGFVSIDTNIFEGGCVLKFSPTNSSELSVNRSATCNSSGYRPIVLTARDDHSVGEQIGEDTLSGYYATLALNLNYNSGIPYSIHDIRISHAQTALDFYGSLGHVLSHAQLVHCGTAYVNYDADVSFRNVLAYSISNVCNGAGANYCTSRWENVTLDQATHFNDTNNDCTFFLTNSLLVAVTNTGAYSGCNNAANSSPDVVFQRVGAGWHYLQSAYRDSGTTNINASLLADLRTKTTFPPVLYQTKTIKLPTTWNPVAQRDTDVPDIGFHYSPLDYTASALVLNTNIGLNITPGTAIAFFGGAGLVLYDGSNLTCTGDPLRRNHFSRYYCVQEISTNWGNSASWVNFYGYNWGGGAGSAQFRFTDFDELPGGGHLELDNDTYSLSNFTLRDCNFNSGSAIFGGGTSSTILLQNNLFERVYTIFGLYPTISCYNTLFWNGLVEIDTAAGALHTFKDNAFDNITLGYDGNLTNANNAYINVSARLQPTNVNDLVLSSLTYQTGFFGPYYQQTNSVLLNSGSRNSTNAGLFAFTTLTNQIPETNSIVDISYHYPVVNLTTGLLADYDSDGLFDVFEDWNSNGSYDSASGETDWQTYNSKYGIGPGPGLVVFTPLK